MKLVFALAFALLATSTTATAATDGVQVNEEFIGTLAFLPTNKTKNSISENSVMAESYCMTAPNLDTIGSDFANVRTGNPDACCQICKAKGCQSYTWTNFEGGTCWFKSAQSQVRISPGARSCRIAPNRIDRTVARFDDDCDLPGNDMFSFNIHHRPACEEICWDSRDCKAMTWTPYNGGTCYFKSSVGTGCKKYGGAKTTVFFNDVAY